MAPLGNDASNVVLGLLEPFPGRGGAPSGIATHLEGFRARFEMRWKIAKLAWMTGSWWNALKRVPVSSAKARDVAVGSCLRR